MSRVRTAPNPNMRGAGNDLLDARTDVLAGRAGSGMSRSAGLSYPMFAVSPYRFIPSACHKGNHVKGGLSNENTHLTTHP